MSHVGSHATALKIGIITFVKCNHKLHYLIKKFRSCFSWYFRFQIFIYCTSLLLLLLMLTWQKPTNKRNAKNNVKAGKNAIKVLNNNNSIQIKRKDTQETVHWWQRFEFFAICSWCWEKEEVLENTRHQLSKKEKECDKFKDQCLALRLENDCLRYIMLCQGRRRGLESKRSGDTVEG